MPLTELDERVFIFLDEVHRVPGWSREVKYYTDLQPMFRFVVTGSSSMHITRGAGESLTGRASVNELHPFSFREFLRYKNVGSPEEFDILSPVSGEPPVIPGFTNPERLRIECSNYLEMGGLPGLYKITDTLERKREMKARIDLTLFRDLLEVFEIRQPSRLSSLLHFLIANAAQVINYSTVTNALKLKYETLTNYLEYLELSHLIHRVPSYETNPLKSVSRNPKIYLADHSFFQLDGCDTGRMVENLCFNHLNRITERRWLVTPGYWMGKRGEEVDFVVRTDRSALPVEIKYRTTITKKDLKGLRAFAREHGTTRAFLITEHEEGTLELGSGDESITVIKLPLWKFLLSS